MELKSGARQNRAAGGEAKNIQRFTALWVGQFS
jgi:hypothetical protein